jgi:hypothetical protein
MPDNRTEKGLPMTELNSQDKIAVRPRIAPGTIESPHSRIAIRARGQSHGPITRLLSPSDLGRLLKPFVFLDLIDNQGKPFSGLACAADN